MDPQPLSLYSTSRSASGGACVYLLFRTWQPVCVEHCFMIRGMWYYLQPQISGRVGTNVTHRVGRQLESGDDDELHMQQVMPC